MQSTLTMLKPLQLRLEKIAKFPKRSHGENLMGTWQRRQTGHHFVWAIYEVPTHRTIAGSITTSSVCSAVFTPPLPGESQHKDRSSLDLNNIGGRFTFSRRLFTRFREEFRCLDIIQTCFVTRCVWCCPEMPQISEKAQRSKSWRSSPRSWTVLQICSSLVVLIHIFFFPLLDRRHLVSKMVSAVANGYEHSVRWRIGLFHINLGKILNCAKIAKFKRRIIIFISC